jgi:7,8-dihydropterin-6-yl-methyl-4-(beta-D-ribofuranosyl)aminobenzene 5'-phosphate synthase
MRITTLVENSPNPHHSALIPEHGLSFYIEHRGHTFLSDVGASDIFAKNARLLGLDLARVEALAITHHHFDHGGGLPHFFEENQQAKVYMCQSESEDVIVKSLFKPDWYVGLDQSVLKKYTDRIIYLAENREILPGVHLLLNIPLLYPKPGGSKRMKIKIGRKTIEDTFDHEMATVLEGDDGLVLLTGCAHRGVLNMIAATKAAFPDLSIKAVIGGFHLVWDNKMRIKQIGKALLESDIPVISTGHCTGAPACSVLKTILGDRFSLMHTGQVYEF